MPAKLLVVDRLSMDVLPAVDQRSTVTSRSRSANCMSTMTDLVSPLSIFRIPNTQMTRQSSRVVRKLTLPRSGGTGIWRFTFYWNKLTEKMYLKQKLMTGILLLDNSLETSIDILILFLLHSYTVKYVISHVIPD